MFDGRSPKGMYHAKSVVPFTVLVTECADTLKVPLSVLISECAECRSVYGCRSGLFFFFIGQIICNGDLFSSLLLIQYL